MSTQDQSGVPVGVAHAPQHFRLLELPDSLLELLTSPNPPVLSIKSRPASATSSASDQQKQASAVLCTSNKTYHLRQVHTSNSVHLTQPANLSARPDALSTLGISAIAKCGSVLEAHPVTESPVSAVREAITRIWHAENWDGHGFAQFSGATVDRAKCVPWVGRNLLAALDSHYRTARPTADFLDLWRDTLPEAWREDAQLEAIKGDYTLPSDHTIAPKGASTLSSTTAGTGTGKGPRKWHEKFKATRKQ
ncbi:putative sister chromatid cohesion protein dcc1 [Diplodia seriata]|uniref:Putative sister chromatid cohesion protein dcc1 n=1 Tax=Diplodia seriata TaxID=420778 RepID=A0A0G2GDE6_9PEZI|nr:putative sister chromatid cohesion protein dcc1 [Diplodia seriata]